ncbi:MAG: hypothetical protein Q9165_007938 [Trypethelium subeluteriae]
MNSTAGSKKRKRAVVVHQNELEENIDTSKPTAVFAPSKGRKHTVSNHKYKGGQDQRNQGTVNEDEHTGWTDPDHFLYHLLSYLEVPPFLRRTLFPFHPNLRTAGALPSLDMPHHLRANEWCPYREGITLGNANSTEDYLDEGKGAAPKIKRTRNSAESGSAPSDDSSEHTLVDIGIPQKIKVPVSIPPNTRVTLKLSSTSETSRVSPTENYISAAEPVHPATPREEAGYYWGYTVRRTNSLSSVFTECPHDGGYDLSIGTSERGQPLSHLLSGPGNKSTQRASSGDDGGKGRLPANWDHLLVVFGGPPGIEAAVSADKELMAAGVKEAKDVFDAWVNVFPGQGSRTIRTEEAIWVGLASLREFVTQREEL